jgi:RNA polymerase sigma factor (sigma-70 family)
MSTIAITAPAGPSSAAVDAVRGAPEPDGQWQPSSRPATAARPAGQFSQTGADLPGRLMAEFAGLAVGDPRRVRLRARIIEWYLPLSAYTARRYGGRGELMDDLTQVAAVALIKAGDRFDPARGVTFPGYAIPTILGEIRRHFRDTTWVVRVPRRFQGLNLQMPAATEELFHALHRAPTAAELAERLGIGLRDMVSAQLSANAYRPVSIERGWARTTGWAGPTRTSRRWRTVRRCVACWPASRSASGGSLQCDSIRT